MKIAKFLEFKVLGNKISFVKKLRFSFCLDKRIKELTIINLGKFRIVYGKE
jgi:hypothetical protein